MSQSDLPEPKVVILSAEEQNARHWYLISTFVTFVAGYSVIHKLLIPFFLKFTQVTKTPYSQVDPYFIHAVLLAYLLTKERRNTKLVSLLCGFGVIYGITEIAHTAQGLYEGWLAVSRLLSAVPLAIASGYVMSQPSAERSFSMAWFGALVGIGSFFAPVLTTTKKETSPEVGTQLESRKLVGVNQECGNSQLNLDLSLDYPETSEIVIKPDCGLKPAIIRSKDETLTVSNQTQTPINIHLMVFERDKQSSRWNMMVPPGTSLKTPKLPKGGLEVGFLYSDNTPVAGVVGLVFIKEKVAKRFYISRSPLRIQAEK